MPSTRHHQSLHKHHHQRSRRHTRRRSSQRGGRGDKHFNWTKFNDYYNDNFPSFKECLPQFDIRELEYQKFKCDNPSSQGAMYRFIHRNRCPKIKEVLRAMEHCKGSEAPYEEIKRVLNKKQAVTKSHRKVTVPPLPPPPARPLPPSGAAAPKSINLLEFSESPPPPSPKQSTRPAFDVWAKEENNVYKQLLPKKTQAKEEKEKERIIQQSFLRGEQFDKNYEDLYNLVKANKEMCFSKNRWHQLSDIYRQKKCQETEHVFHDLGQVELVPKEEQRRATCHRLAEGANLVTQRAASGSCKEFV